MSKQKKFRLKKWYPSLPDKWKGKDGLIVEKTGANYYAHLSKPLGTGIGVKVDEVQNNPEFWEEVVEKDYEITAYKYGGQIYYLENNSYFPKNNGKGYQKWFLEKSTNADIFSVRRKSDGEVFTIGDRISGLSYNDRYIIGFRPERTHIIHQSQSMDTENGGYSKIQNIEHNKNPIFTTEDGVDIHKGDEYYFVGKVTNEVLKNKVRTKESWLKANGDYDAKRFADKEKAKEYIEENKPRYSKADIKRVASLVEKHLKATNCSLEQLILREFMLD